MRFMKIILALTIAASAASAHGASNIPLTLQSRNSQTMAGIQMVAANGWVNVTGVYYSGGTIVKGSGSNWVETGDDGATFNFVEVGRDNTSIYLRDNSRGVNLRLNLSEEEIFYSDDSGKGFPLSTITGILSGPTNTQSGQIGQAASVTVAEYTCNEGIPLVLEFEEAGGNYSVTWIHDGFRGGTLPQVVSGSGNRFAANGVEIHTKGDAAYVNNNGSEDNCTKVN